MAKPVIPIHKAQALFPMLVRRAAQGETILIGTRGGAIAQLVAVDKILPTQRHFGALKGEFEVPDDFDDPLSNDLLDAFEGR